MNACTTVARCILIHPEKTWFDSCLVSNECNRLKRLYDSRAESWILIVLKDVCIHFKWEYYQPCLLIYLVMFSSHQTSKGNWMHIQFQSKLQAKKVSMQPFIQSVCYLFWSHEEVDFFLLQSKNGNCTMSLINDCLQL